MNGLDDGAVVTGQNAESVRDLAARIADYVETARSYGQWSKREAMVEAVRVACEDAGRETRQVIAHTEGSGGDVVNGLDPWERPPTSSLWHDMEAARRARVARWTSVAVLAVLAALLAVLMLAESGWAW